MKHVKAGWQATPFWHGTIVTVRDCIYELFTVTINVISVRSYKLTVTFKGNRLGQKDLQGLRDFFGDVLGERYPHCFIFQFLKSLFQESIQNNLAIN